MATRGKLGAPVKRKADAMADGAGPGVLPKRPASLRRNLNAELRSLLEDMPVAKVDVLDTVDGARITRSKFTAAAAPNLARARAGRRLAALPPSPPPRRPQLKAPLRKAAGRPQGKPPCLPQCSDEPEYLPSVKLDGKLFTVGDSVYVVLDEACLATCRETKDVLFECGICQKVKQKSTELLECSRCLGGFHLTCLDPPLAAIPEGDWFCPGCAAGHAPRRAPATCPRAHFLAQSGLGMARIDSIWRDPGDREVKFRARWYYLPEETHGGRQRHHAAREVFLSHLRDDASAHSILQRAGVQPPSEYSRNVAIPGVDGDDVYMCEYEYDCVWQRFRRRSEWDTESEDEGGQDWEVEHSEDEEHDETFKPQHAFMDEQGGEERARRWARGKGARRAQGGEDFLGRVGTLHIPEHVRRRAPATALDRARDALTLAAVPRSLPCREAERASVESFIEEVLGDGETASGKCLYISGIPGTGKTATVLEVMRSMRRRTEAGDLPQFQFVQINGLLLPSPQHAYSTLYEALTGERLGPANAAAALEEMFAADGGSAARGRARARSRRPTIVLLDEMDLLVNRTQTVLYNMFDWPSRRGSRLSIIGIANTMDLPERLHPRIGSRLAGRRVVFHPYRREQLETIVRSRLEGFPVFDANAVLLAARKVANCSGDVRRCLELCRRAAEIAQELQQGEGREGAAEVAEETDRVTLKHVDAAIREAFNTLHVKLLEASSRLERLVLAALHLEARFTGRPEAALEAVADRLDQLCMANNEARYPFSAVLQCAVGLGAVRLLLCDPGHKRLKAKVALNVPVNDLLYVLTKEDAELPWLAERLK